MKKRMKLFCILLFIGMGVSFAQTQVSGTVTDENGEPVIGASVIVQGTTKGVATNHLGDFSIDAPSNGRLVVSSIGYASQTVSINNRTRISIVLIEDTRTLKEVEITAEFGMKRVARSVGSSAQNVKATDITESGRDNFISALQGRVSGMNVTSTGGAPGASTTVILRSITSISGNNQPLYVIDGVPMNNSTFDPIAFAGTERYSVRSLDFASRGNDLNPEDIAEVTVLKGAAAAALYGSDASNGAIIITTKKGRAGKGQVTYSNSFRWDKSYGFPEVQTKYANGAYGTTNYYFTNRYGGLYPDGMELYDNLSQIMQTGFTQKHNIAVDGGNEKTTLRAAASFLGQEGVVKSTDYNRLNLTLSGKSEITKWLKFEGSMQYTNTENNKALRGTDGPLYRALLWPIVDNMANYLAEDGSHMRLPTYYTDTDLLNPLFGLFKNKFFDTSDRFLSNVAVTVNPIENAFIRAQLGWDVGMQTFITSEHPYYSNNNNGDGYYNLVKANFSDPTMNILAGYNNVFFDEKLTFGAQIGYHQLENGVTRLITNGSKFIIPDFQSINNTTPSTISTSQRTTKRRIQAISAQFEFGYQNLAFLTLRGRNDWSSTLPVVNNRYFYPAVEASLVLSELGFMKNVEPIDFLKIRGTIAQVGKDAGPLEIDPQLEPTLLTGGGFKYGFTGPNKKLRPEMATSKEAGFEFRILDERINGDFTYFHTHNADQIVKGFRLSYATGFVLNNMNVGTFNTWGWEGHIDGDIIRNNNFRWNVGLNMSQTHSKVVDLPENVTEYYNPYTWNSGNIRNGIMVGHPVTTLTGRAYLRNDNGTILIDPKTGLPLIDPKWSVLGDREPKLRFGITSAFTYKGFRASAMFSGRYKATVVNGTKRTMMTSGTSWESVDLRERGPVVFNGVLRDGNENTPNPTINNIAVDYKSYGTSIYGGNDEDWLEKNVNYLRLQELRLSYRIPPTWLKTNLPLISNADIFFTGNDLFTLTNYSGIDAVGNTVSAAAGGTGGEGYDVWSLPNPRGLSFGLSFTFN